MKITYLGHSGFLVETDNAFYLFDYIRGKLPKECRDKKAKQIFVFVSHAHGDHFVPDIFDFKGRFEKIKYVLSYDVVKKIKHTKRFQERAKGCDIINIRYDETISLDNYGVSPQITVSTLKSTDEGVAFLVEDPEGVIYHAGDLNWWHWKEEGKAWNRNMEVNFKREIAKLENTKIDIAFVPLDPRQEEYYWLGMQYFLACVAVKKVYPMHFWDEPEIIDRYIKEHGKDFKKYDTQIEKEL